MGKYAIYVLPAYGVSAVLIGLMVFDTLWRAHRWRAEVRRREQALAKSKEPRSP